MTHPNNESSLSVGVLTEGQWYKLLIENYVTMEETETGEVRLKGCRVELLRPEIDWENGWRLARLQGLGTELSSFMFKLMHQILPTQERVSRTNPATSNLCKQPNCSTASVEDLPHALVHCSSNNGVGLKVVQAARRLIPGVTVEDLLQLNFGVEEDKELGIVWWLAAGLMAIWNLRTARKRVEQYLIRAQLEAKINLLRETRFADAVEILDTLLVEL